jgi:hypothetical protein
VLAEGQHQVACRSEDLVGSGHVSHGAASHGVLFLAARTDSSS